MKGNEKFKGLVPAHYKQVHTFKCKVCKKEFASAYVKDTCTRTCTNISKARTKIIAWKRNEFCPVTEDGSLLVWARKYLKDKANNQCSVCGWAEVNPFHGNTPLEIDHIDGNWQNYKYENFRVLCPNCHALTQHYKVYNKQNGKSRYDHWKEKGWW
jgi:Zn finger protein HypA/HybF involved in hydrogenase expression